MRNWLEQENCEQANPGYLESYTDITMERKGKKIPLAGLIKPKGWTKGIMIMGAGTKGFKELNTILIEKYPKAKDAEHQEAFSAP